MAWRSCCALLCDLHHVGLPRRRASLLVRLQLWHESCYAGLALVRGNAQLEQRAELATHRVVRQPTGETDDESLLVGHLDDLSAVAQVESRNVTGQLAENTPIRTQRVRLRDPDE